MDKHIIILGLGIAFMIVGAIMAFYNGYYSSEWWRSKSPQKPLGAEASQRLARFQGLVVLLMGVAFVYLAIFK
jgi:hypothetical protein